MLLTSEESTTARPDDATPGPRDVAKYAPQPQHKLEWTRAWLSQVLTTEGKYHHQQQNYGRRFHIHFVTFLRWVARWIITIYFAVDLFTICGGVVLILCLVRMLNSLLRPLLPSPYKQPYDTLYERFTGKVLNGGVRVVMSFACAIWSIRIISPSQRSNISATADNKMSSIIHSSWIPKQPSAGLFGRISLPEIPAKCIIMSNHLSNLDGFILRAILSPNGVKCCYKSSLTRIPIVGWALYLCGDVPVYFNGSKGGWGVDGVERTMERSKKIIENGCNFLVFPEGARRKYNRMAPFRLGYFRLAIENNYPIWPMVVHGTDVAWGMEASTLEFGNLYVSFSDRIFPPLEGDTAESFAERIQSEMLRLLENIPGYDSTKERPFANMSEYLAEEARTAQSPVDQESKAV